MGLPCCEIIRAVYRDAATFNLALALVLAKPVESSGILVDTEAAGVSVENIPVGIEPPSAWDDPFGRRACGQRCQREKA